jgi:hypothetical protein
MLRLYTGAPDIDDILSMLPDGVDTTPAPSTK